MSANEVINAMVYSKDEITENFVTEFLNQYGETFSWKAIYGDGWTSTKREKIIFTYEVQCINIRKQPQSKISTCCRCSLPS